MVSFKESYSLFGLPTIIICFCGHLKMEILMIITYRSDCDRIMRATSNFILKKHNKKEVETNLLLCIFIHNVIIIGWNMLFR